MSFTLGTPLADTTVVKLIDEGTDEILMDSNGLPMTIEVYGSDSKKYRKTRAKVLKEDGDKRASKRRTPDALVEEITANCIKTWNIEKDGAKIPYTPESALELFGDDRPIYEQVIGAQTDRGLFFQKSPKS